MKLHRVLWTIYTDRHDRFLADPTPDHADDAATAYEVWLSEAGLTADEVADHAKRKRLALIEHLRTHRSPASCK